MLASITRAAVIELCDVQEQTGTLAELKAADEVFIASTAVEVQGVGAVDEREYAGRRAASPRRRRKPCARTSPLELRRL